MKKRITITLDKNLVDWLGKNIDGIKIKNRSHVIECLLNECREKERFN